LPGLAEAVNRASMYSTIYEEACNKVWTRVISVRWVNVPKAFELFQATEQVEDEDEQGEKIAVRERVAK